MKADDQSSRGVLARLPPAQRALAIVALGACVVVGAILIDPSGFARDWREARLETLERVLNVLFLFGSIWIVLLEGEAILAAFARMFANQLAFKFSALIDVLKRAGHSLPAIQAMIAELRGQMSSRKSRSASQSQEPLAKLQESDAFGRTTEREPPPTSPQSAQHGLHKKWVLSEAQTKLRWIVVGTILLIIACMTIISAVHQPPVPPPPLPPPAQVWMATKGSISETLAACMGRPSWELLEKSVAEANGIECTRIRASLVCRVQDRQPLRLTPEVGRCERDVPTFETRERAVAASAR